MKFLKNQKMGIKLTVVIVLTLIIAFTINITLTILQFSEYNEKVSEEQAIRGMEGLDARLEDLKTEAVNIGNILSTNQEIVKAIEAGDSQNLLKVLDTAVAKSTIDFVTVTDDKGMVIVRTHDHEKKGDSIVDQVNIKSALAGTAFSTVEKGSVINFSVRAGVPVKNGNGEIIGAVSAGYRLDKVELLDQIKALYKTDVTIFFGDVRHNTTIVKDGKRVIGTKLDAKIAEKVLVRNEQHIGAAVILGMPYVTAYKPLIGPNNQAIGVVFAGQQLKDVLTARNNLITTILLFTIPLTLILIIFIGIFVRKNITNPLGRLVHLSNTLAEGDVNVSIKSDSKDEIGELMNSFGRMVDNIRQQANAAEKIAVGDLNVEIKPKSERDILSNSMTLVAKTLSDLVKEAEMLTNSAVEGKLKTRGDTGKFSGVYKEILEGVNNTLDAVVEPINEASMVLKELSEGNLKEYVKGNYEGDHAVIKDSLNSTVDTLSEYIREITDVLTELSKGNLHVSIAGEYKGDFVGIKNSLNMIIESLNSVLSDINNAAEQVAAGSRQVSDTSTSLSQGSTEQASSIQQLSASVEEIAAKTKKNAVSAKEANDLALVAKDTAVEGNNRMKDMLQAISKINESSVSISKIIKVIDEIAFQTNILALNAAVEAARAGQYGKGFAVVAEEVRNLAAKSAAAAKETTTLIEDSINRVEAGTSIANDTADALNRIVDNISRVSSYASSIAEASNDQATSVAQINQGIGQVSQVIQTNSAISQQSAAASEELSSHAEILKDLVGNFNLKRNNSKKNHNEELTPEILKMLEKMTLEKDGEGTNTSNKGKKARRSDKLKIDLQDKEFGKY